MGIWLGRRGDGRRAREEGEGMTYLISSCGFIHPHNGLQSLKPRLPHTHFLVCCPSVDHFNDEIF